MKTFLIVLSILAIFFIIVQIYVTMSAVKTETQAYSVLLVKDQFEIRLYPLATMAVIQSNLRSYKELGSSGFKKLAGYIFGGNASGKKIAMTTPVRMDMDDSTSTMSFVMPNDLDSTSLPKPNDQQVQIKTFPAEYVAATRFGGYASEEDIAHHINLLKQQLTEQGILFYGNFRFLGYNAPYQLVNRRNEIIVNVQWDAKQL